MQKWSQENPALMAQAGLASSAGTLSAEPHFIDASAADQKVRLMNIAGVDPSRHSPHVHPHAGHSGKKGKGKKGKGNMNHIPEIVAAITKGVMETMQHGTAVHTSTHNKNKPYSDASSNKLAQAYTASQGFYNVAVNEAIAFIDVNMAKFPPPVRTPFYAAFVDLKQYRLTSKSVTYDHVYEKISGAHTAYAVLVPGLKYAIHPPKTTPSERADGVKSLLSKLMSLTIETLKALASDTETRTKNGYYDLKTQRRIIAATKKNSNEVHQALVRALAMEKKAADKKLGVNGHTMAHPSHQSHMPGYAAGTASEFGADHGSFSMAHPYTP